MASSASSPSHRVEHRPGEPAHRLGAGQGVEGRSQQQVGQRGEVGRRGAAVSALDDAVGEEEQAITGLERGRLLLTDGPSEAHRSRWHAMERPG